ncbi:MAG: hypothetical protein FWE83_10970 [Oscillospiraceae bacterium]|nr:hypothetical protein [Oscillospiraceae bacterium]
MDYEIMNRKEARYASGETGSPTTAIISITDVGDEQNEFYPASWIHAVLHIQFDDVIERGYNCITKTNAQEIAKFALENYDKVERFLIHCEFGQSRSAGVAAALCQHFEGHDNGISTDPRYFPNWTCYKYVFQALGETKTRKK